MNKKKHPKLNRKFRIRPASPLCWTWLGLAALPLAPAFAQDGPDWDLIDEYCTACHNYADYAGSIAFDLLDRDSLLGDAATWELALRKISTGMMPPAGEPRPPRAELDHFVASLGRRLDQEYALAPDPGNEGMGRLNRSEYANAIRDLLHYDASRIVATLPGESDGEGFDNNVEVLSVSPTLIDAYASAAMRISREAVGDLSLIPSQISYPAGSGRQTEHVDGLPLGTRGGLLVTHNFPLDATYEIVVQARGAGGVFNPQAFCDGANEVVVTIDGETFRPENPERFQLPLSAGPHTIGVALRDTRRCTGVNDFYDEFSLGGAIAGLEIGGPFEVSGPGNTPSRRAIFVCYPANASEESACARRILSNLATRAYRRPVAENAEELDVLMDFHQTGSELGGFEMGIQYALARLLIDPRFLYQIEEQPAGLAPGQVYAVNDIELASRLSFFLWSSIPDEELLQLAAAGELGKPAVLEQQVRRMLRDPKASALVSNFASQWLMLRELDVAEPQDNGFNDTLRRAFRQETELMFEDLMREDRGLLSLLETDYTWLNADLARHYGISGVRGEYMRRVPLPADSPRRGLLGQGSILTATSVANRTSPVVRGAWIVESLLGAPVPTPPPGVETDLGEGEEVVQATTLRERLEQHRENPVCASCHQIMDPIGLALENFDLVGRWRTQENGHPLDTRTVLADGTLIDGPTTLRRALLDRGEAVASNTVEQLMSYALGRHLHPHDMAAVRRIVSEAAPGDWRFSDVVLGIVNSDPFRMKRADSAGMPVAER